MDTIYYRLNGRKVKVSGGEDWVAFVPETPAVRGSGKVLDFAQYRAKLVPEEQPPETPAAKDTGNWDFLEKCATAAVLFTALAASLAFLGWV